MTDDDFAQLQAWVGREVSLDDWLHPAAPRQLAATLDLVLDVPADTATPIDLPPLWQMLYGLEASPSAALGEDGAPVRVPGQAAAGSVLPPVPMAEIMWAGADYSFHTPLRTVAPATCRTRVAAITQRKGRRGPLVFVSLANAWSQDGRVALTETTHAVFMDAAPTGRGAAAEAPAACLREASWPMDEKRLFRFSALTFNAHRIHYDHTYARDRAGYPGLVVHGPLQALLIAETWRRWNPGRTLRQASYRARAPLFLDGPVTVCGGPDSDGQQMLWTRASDGAPAMEATFSA